MDISFLDYTDGELERCRDREVTARLAGIWGELFDDEEFQVRPEDDFFMLGGSSLLALSLIERVRHTFQVSLALRDLLRLSTFQALADHIAEIQPVALGVDDMDGEDGAL